MGDAPARPSTIGEYSTQPSVVTSHPESQGIAQVRDGEAQGQRGISASEPLFATAFPAQFEHHQYQQKQQRYGDQQYAFSSQYEMTQHQSPSRGGGPYNMGPMMNALPQQPNYRDGQQQQQQLQSQPPPVSSAGMSGQSMAPFVGLLGPMNPMPGQQYYMGAAQHGHHVPPQYYGAVMNPQQQQQHRPQEQSQQQDVMSPQANMGFYQHGHTPRQYYYAGHAGNYPNQTGMMQSHMGGGGQYMPQTDRRFGLQQPLERPRQQVGHDPKGDAGAKDVNSREQSDDGETEPRSSIVRGPPRKPRQSGHAIWIGNLPPQTDLMSLVYHVCKEAPGLESVFLISKSNCAFANFKDEETCLSAQRKLHDSQFQSVRLVSRLRKNTVEGVSGVTAPTGPASLGPSPNHTVEAGIKVQLGPSPSPRQRVDRRKWSPAAEVGDTDGAVAGSNISADGGSSRAGTPKSGLDNSSGPDGGTPQNDRYFILKSLTVEDLDLSVQTGIWATQSHNEHILNSAFQNAGNVYLIFSANKSGEYYGYARMTSTINEDPAAAIEFAPKAQLAGDVGLPKAIPTEATEFAPKGSIMDDSERGTIFWEADLEADVGSAAESNTGRDTIEVDGAAGSGDADETGGFSGAGEIKTWGKPFQLEWISTARLPFYRTRGLRNPWNCNREVKIARDGTELEPQVGRKLTSLFGAPRPMGHNQYHHHQGPPGLAMHGVGGGPRHTMVPGYNPMRP